MKAKVTWFVIQGENSEIFPQESFWVEGDFFEEILVKAKQWVGIKVMNRSYSVSNVIAVPARAFDWSSGYPTAHIKSISTKTTTWLMIDGEWCMFPSLNSSPWRLWLEKVLARLRNRQ